MQRQNPSQQGNTGQKKKRFCERLRLQRIPKPDTHSQQTDCGDACIRPSPPKGGISPGTSTPSMLTRFQDQRRFSNRSNDYPVSKEVPFWEFLPIEFRNNIRTALEKGILFSFLCTLTEDVVTDIMKPKNYTKDQIYWTNQVLKSLILIVGGVSIGKSIAGPVINLLLMEGFGIKREISNYVATGLIVGAEIFLNPTMAIFSSLLQGKESQTFSLTGSALRFLSEIPLSKVLTIGTVLPANISTSMTTHFGYKKLKQLTSAGFDTLNAVGQSISEMAGMSHARPSHF